MKRRIRQLITGLCLMPLAAWASSVNLPIRDDTQWYIHANLLEMRQTVAGQELYGWVEREIISDLEEEFDIRLTEELDGVTVFGSAAGHEDGAVVLHGFLSAATRDAVLAKIREEGYLASEDAFGRVFYAVAAPDELKKSGHPFDGAYLAFGDMGQTLVTGNRQLIEDFLAAGGHFEGRTPSELLVIQADRPLVQGGFDAANIDAGGGPWESQMFQNIEQFALVIADDNGLLDIRARITAVSPDMALAISNIIQGVVSLKAVAEEEPAAAALLSRLKMETDDRTVHLQLSIEPATVVEILD